MSRATHAELLKMAVTFVHTDLYDDIRESWEEDPGLKKIITELQRNVLSHPQYTWKDSQLKRRNKLVVATTRMSGPRSYLAS